MRLYFPGGMRTTDKTPRAALNQALGRLRGEKYGNRITRVCGMSYSATDELPTLFRGHAKTQPEVEELGHFGGGIEDETFRTARW